MFAILLSNNLTSMSRVDRSGHLETLSKPATESPILPRERRDARKEVIGLHSCARDRSIPGNQTRIRTAKKRGGGDISTIKLLNRVVTSFLRATSGDEGRRQKSGSRWR